jgi:hypothetical protein
LTLLLLLQVLGRSLEIRCLAVMSLVELDHCKKLVLLLLLLLLQMLGRSLEIRCLAVMSLVPSPGYQIMCCCCRCCCCRCWVAALRSAALL